MLSCLTQRQRPNGYLMILPRLRWSKVPPAEQRQFSPPPSHGETSPWPFVYRRSAHEAVMASPFHLSKINSETSSHLGITSLDREGHQGSQVKGLPKVPQLHQHVHIWDTRNHDDLHSNQGLMDEKKGQSQIGHQRAATIKSMFKAKFVLRMSG